MVTEEWPYDEAVLPANFAEMHVDFAALEKIIERALDLDERRDIATAAWRVWAAYPYGLPMTRRMWERSFRKGDFKVAFRAVQGSSRRLSSGPPPSGRAHRGPRGYPEVNRLILFLNRRLRIGKYTTRDILSESGASHNEIGGRFVEAVIELVKQMRFYAPPGLLPPATALPRYIKHVLESATGQRAV